MKHGDKAKAKSAKAKASGKDASSKKVVAKSNQGAEKSSGSKAVKAGVKKDTAPKTGGNGKGKTGGANGGSGFSNPVIAEAFRRAVKKYPSAFRRLTD